MLRPCRSQRNNILRKSIISLKSAVKGSMMAQVCYGDKEAKSSPLVLTDDGQSKLG